MFGARAYLAAGAVGLLIASHGWAYWTGRGHEAATWEAERAALVAERQRQAARIMGLAEALESAQAARAALAGELEDAAHADDDAGHTALPARSLQRIDRR